MTTVRPTPGARRAPLRPPLPRRATLAVLAAGLFWGHCAAVGQTTLRDPSLAGLRKAADQWERRPGPDRQVVDMVCLVPDVATFFEAIATWDDKHFFPILIDDVESNLKFLRAFRPAKVVRFPRRGESGTPEEDWTRALIAAGRAWVPEGVPLREQPRGDVMTKSLGPVPPAVVASHPGSPTLAGAVALAAGRFQPILRWQIDKTYGDILTAEEALKAASTLEAELAANAGRYWELGDDLDFVTLAGDYPYRFLDNGARNSFDDLILRSFPSKERWAYAGRLIGGPVESVYQAMCSLFLPPKSGLMFNGYDGGSAPWTDYAVTGAAALLNRRFKVGQRSLERARLNGWHQSFDPINPYDLLFINSSGGQTSFALNGGSKAQTSDIPESDPVAVHIIHSYSAWAPEDPQTIAGRWLANGAFIYYGSTNEPYLQSFRTPMLVASCLDENLPMVAAVRKLHFEIFGQPWRLIYLGDPLYRVRPTGPVRPRPAAFEPAGAWPAYLEYKPPEPGSPEAVRLNWALKTAIVRLQSAPVSAKLNDLAATLLGIDRDRLDAPLKPIYDALLVDTLLQADRNSELIDRLQRIKPAERSAAVARHLETAQAAALVKASAAGDFRQALALWTSVLGVAGSPEYFKTFTERVGELATAPNQLTDWRNRLRAARQAAPVTEHVAALDEELKRVDTKIREQGKSR